MSQAEGFLNVQWHEAWRNRKITAYDCIFVTCGMTSIPPAYEEQLREGGRLIIPLGKPDGQELLRLEKRNGKLVMGRCAGT
jgi:protein-L-isoaspartate O-methyltransferase